MITNFKYLRQMKAVLAVLALLTGISVSAASAGDLTAGLDAFIARALQDSQVPGIAVAIIAHDRVVYSKGFGVQGLKTKKPVTADTLFEIGSMSKAFTSTAIAMLTDAGQVKWDDSAASRVKDFQLADPVLTREVSIRDLVSHRTGVANDNLVFWGSGLSTSELIQRAKYLPTHSPIRTKFEYNNLLFALAGEVIPNATGTSWGEFVKKRIFAPLRMQTSYTTLPEVPKGADLAEGHLNYGGDVHAIVLTDLSNIAPAGAIVSNLRDMTTWAQFQLGDGSLNGVRLLSNTALQETHSPQIVMTGAPPFGLLYPDAKLSAYGLGWMLSDFHGHLLIQHPGDTDGMSGLLALMPDQQTAVVVLTNQQGAWLRSAVLFQILDSITDQPPKDRSAQYLAIAKAVEAQQAKVLAAASTAVQPPQADTQMRPLKDYVGRFSNELYGNATVELVQGQLTLRLLGNVAQLNRLQGESFAVRFQHPNALQQLTISSIVFKAAGANVTGFQISNGAAFSRTGP